MEFEKKIADQIEACLRLGASSTSKMAKICAGAVVELINHSEIPNSSRPTPDKGIREALRELGNSTRSWELEKQAMEWLSANHANLPPNNSIAGWIQNRMDLIEARLKHGKQALDKKEV